MSHQIEKRYKVLTARSAEEITNEINYFCRNKKTESVTVTACDHNLQGTGLRSCDYMLVFIATITYEYDITEEKITDELASFIKNKVEEKMQNIPNNPIYNTLYGKDLREKLIDEVKNSDEFKAFYNEVIEKYNK